jgi:hypothetical protein
MKAIDFAVSRILPEDLRQPEYDLSKKGVSLLLAQVAERYPDRFKDIAKKLGDLGRMSAWRSGYATTPEDTMPVIDTAKYYAQMDAELAALRKEKPDPEEFAARREEIMMKYSDILEKETMREALRRGNAFARAVASGARGNPAHIKAILSTPGIYQDSAGKTIPLFVRNSFASGVRPAELLAGTYGARQAVTCLRYDTMVRMADDTHRQIKDIRVDDWVMGAARNGNLFPVRVSEIFDQGMQPVAAATFAKVPDGQTLRVKCTMAHKFLTKEDGDVVALWEIGKERSVVIDGGEARLTQITPLGSAHCFDIEVEHPDHLFVLANGIVTSNSTKRATAKGGDLLKITTQNTSRYNITEKDCGANNGIDLTPDDSSLRGRVLARPAGDLPAGTIIDRQVASRLQRYKKPVIVRSPLTCQAEHGLCAKCAGLQANGKLPNLGDSIGITASAAINEPIVQASLNCLTEGTLVRMADYSVRPIQDVRVGDCVLGADILGNTFPVRVLARHDQGMQPVQTYTYRMAQTKQTLSLTCTECHPILQITKYSGAKEEEIYNHTPRKLPAGRKAGRPSAVLPKAHFPALGLYDEPMAKLIGYLLGDGIRITSDIGAVKLSCADTSTAEDIGKFLKGFGMKLGKVKRSHDWIVTGNGNKCRIRNERGQFVDGNYRTQLRNAVTRLGLEGVYAHEKKLPDEVVKWSNDSIADLIANYTSADGSVFHASGKWPGVSFGSTSKELLDGVKNLLAIRFCVYASSITRTGKAGDGNRVHDMWAFTITRRDQVKRFADVVRGRAFGKKADLLDKLIAKSSPSNMDLPFYKARRVRIEDAGIKRCWDLSVDHPDELFVLHNSLIVKNTKHSGGMAKGKKSFSGFDYVSQFVQIPEEFKDRAAVSERDGVVDKVEDAPQGGKYVYVDGEQHFVLPGFDVLVKPGDKVEAGDQLSDGLVNPSDIVRLRGLGEGRRYYADRLGKILEDSGNPPDRINMEILAKAAVDNYMIDDPEEDDPWLPDDLVREGEFLKRYKPPADTSPTKLDKAVGAYLQQPVLHYTVGTRLTPKMIQRMRDVGVENVLASRSEPRFKPEMQRLRVAAHDSADWITSLSTSYLSTQMRTALERGDETNIKENLHYAPRLAFGADAGAGGFGERVEQTGKF